MENRKERLNEIEVQGYEDDGDNRLHVLVKEDDYLYLREQAERVEELEREHSEFKTRFRSMQIKHGIAKDRRNEYFNKNLNLESENKRYRKVLENVRQYINKYWDKGYKIQAELYIRQELEGDSDEGD